MSTAHTGVPTSPAEHALPVPVPSEEYERCPVTGLLRRLGDKWTLVLLSLLARRPYRFNELHRAVEGISQRMLTRTLRTLEADGLVEREVFPTVPPSVEYRLAPPGVSLMRSLSPLATWAVEHARRAG
ncbi:helix-turn-helix transcriptional regulator [Dactylosporangium aurantiacum]|uniref:Helix-turn-helix transcriptional regulator n=1 Tax=Dactylosporangium aurantiacum TaxID=35754 RepID=A0A9Q9MLW3_9ACTN|nr:helix-turn-helix domain-containing protein [Dactylosporangium aurantiacum]MDG6107824.1 helix-turn-helix domain-containing protein [Dactylosporangium aurantiacum]UWZ57401.1 helix-turn-helix transcriptional regulator [Dactylosporangium aurantiacum]